MRPQLARVGPIESSGEQGIVELIGLRSTRILGDNGGVAVAPDGHLAKISITNVTAIEESLRPYEVLC